ncbi:long-chain-alcohol oxidase FAO4A-like [Gastrolobium bilobum]|uniref:long-chain-alcohol oxidase FAO4A-like n=1 Tax=Gastrolobium bilobum TaxID=150636 RepID=UPI002AB1B6F9|nr:long-chain-alcohol oxidase FAO4A-like [Gastrolobium bilobum]
MENNGESNSRGGSFRLGLGVNEAKVHTVVELGSVDTHSLLLECGDVVGNGEEREKQKKPLTNCLSTRQMKSLIALSDTILPSIKDSFAGSSDESVSNFYRTSASMAGTPERLGIMISEKLKHPSKWLLLLTLWLLSTWFGTFILCGMPSLSTKFPFFHSYSDMSMQKRQQVLQSWSLSYFRLLRKFFRTIKLLTLFVFFTQLDEAEDNPSWKAIGYTGPDPEFKAQLKKHFLHRTSKEGRQEEKEYDKNADEVMGPLYRGLVHLNYPHDIITNALRQFGFHVSVTPGKNKASNISSPSLVIQCDAVVVGSGSGGGVVAGVLAKSGYKVLVLEKGSYSARNNLSLLEGPTMDQMYLSSGLIATDDMSVLMLAGSTVGGGSAINWSASIKTPQHVCKEWCDLHGLELFESKLYKEALNAVCEKMGVQSEIDEEGFNNAVLRKGCQEMGYPVSNIPRNAPPDHYCGWCNMGCKDGRKKSTSETWLVDLVKSGNGAIFPSCEAIQVLHKEKKGRDKRVACGVAFAIEYKGNKNICVVESKVTIVACGALSTPALLKRSGLKNENIGRHLHLHPVSMAWGYFPDAPSSPELWPEEHKRSYEGGIMTAMSTVVAEYDKSGYGSVIQTPTLHPGMFSILMPWISGMDIKDRMCKFSRTAHVFALARDQGSGTVKSPNSISYQMKDVDKENLEKGIEKVLRILAAAGAEEIGTHNNKGRSLNVKQVSYNEFEKFVKEESSRPLTDLSTPLCSAHQMGSCRMGTNPKDSVVNQMGETWEVEDLYLADSSVFPTALGVNPMVTVQAIAYCTAQYVLEVLRRKRSR